MKKRKVLGILPSYAAGGAEKIMLAYFHNLEKRPFFLKLFVVNKIGPLKTKLANTFECEYKRFIYSIPKLLCYIKKNKFSIIYSTFPHITIALIITKFLKLHNCKIIVRQPNMLYASLNNSIKLRIIKFIYLRVINLSDAIIITSEAMRKEAIKYKFNKEKIHLLPNPINISCIRSKVTPERNNKSLIKLVFVGRLSYQKGLDRVLNLFPNIKNIEFLIIGEGAQKKKLERFVKKNNLQKKITFYGFIPRPYNIIAGSDYFLLPSRWEGMPNCVLEALALGTPVIAFEEIESLKDFTVNLKNKTITLVKNNKSMLKLLNSLQPRKDNLNPKLRNSLLNKPLSETTYRKKLDKIISSIL